MSFIKIEQGKGIESAEGGRWLQNRKETVDLTEKMSFEQRVKGCEGVCYVTIWWKSVRWKWEQLCQGKNMTSMYKEQ